jgi:hypothetical protein
MRYEKWFWRGIGFMIGVGFLIDLILIYAYIQVSIALS